MPTRPRRLHRLLLRTDAELERRERERRECETQLEQLGRSRCLSGKDCVRLAALKKLKLLVPHRMEPRIARRLEQTSCRPAAGAASPSGVQ